MKRTSFLLSILFLIGSGVFGQSLQLMYGDDIVSNDTVYMTGTITDDLLELHIKVKNLTDKEIEVKVRKTEISIVDGSVNTFCWGGSCFMPTVFTSPLSTSIRANGTDFNSFAGDYEPSGMAGTSVISYTFFNVQNEEDSVMVTAFYQVGADGIHSIDLARNIKVYPNPIRDNFTIEFETPSNDPYKIRLYNLEGKMIKEFEPVIQASKHFYNVEDIANGYAIIDISNSEGLAIRRKILVNR